MNLETQNQDTNIDMKLENQLENSNEAEIDNNIEQKTETIISKIHTIQEKYWETSEWKELIEKIQTLNLSAETEKYFIWYLEQIQKQFWDQLKFEDMKVILTKISDIFSEVHWNHYEEIIVNNDNKEILSLVSWNTPVLLFKFDRWYISSENNTSTWYEEVEKKSFLTGSIPFDIDQNSIDKEYHKEEKNITVELSKENYKTEEEIRDAFIFELSKSVKFSVEGSSYNSIVLDDKQESEKFTHDMPALWNMILSNVQIFKWEEKNGYMSYSISYTLYTKKDNDE